MSVSRIKLAVAAIAAAALVLCAAPAALANTAKSSNWAGYAVHRSGVKFKRCCLLKNAGEILNNVDACPQS